MFSIAGCVALARVQQSSNIFNKKGRPIGTTGYRRDSRVFFLTGWEPPGVALDPVGDMMRLGKYDIAHRTCSFHPFARDSNFVEAHACSEYNRKSVWLSIKKCCNATFTE
jgi:hypothetical protein